MELRLKLKSYLKLLIFGLISSALIFVCTHASPTISQTVKRPLETSLFDKAVQDAKTFVMPAEFEEIDSLWMAYPVYENMKGRPSQIVQENMIKALAPHTSIDILVQDEAEEKKVKQWLSSMNIPSSRVRLHIAPHTDIWTRDMGAIFVRNPNGEMKIADFGFNTWSYNDSTNESAITDEEVDILIARDMKLPIIRSNLISEGGNREFNGKGTLMVTEAVELQRNPGLTKEEVETELKRVFNIKKVIWLKQGLADDDLSYKGKLPNDTFTVLTTGGHIDEFARFASEDTILLAQVTPQERDEDPIARITYERMEENYRILQTSTDQDGKPFKIVRVPIPAPIYEMMDEDDEVFKLLKELKFEDGTVISEGSKIKTILAASYLNFVIANDVILIPSYWKVGRSQVFRQKDDLAKQILQKAFPNQKIVQINPENINAGGGGMHCIVQQMPKARAFIKSS